MWVLGYKKYKLHIAMSFYGPRAYKIKIKKIITNVLLLQMLQSESTGYSGHV